MRKSAFVLGVFLLLGLVPLTHAQTANQLQAQLDALLAQLAALQAQLQSSGSPGSVPTTGSSSYGQCPSLFRSLRSGISGSDVTALQAFLAADSRIYPEGTVSGYYGSLTEAAIQRFQVRHGIVTSGTPDTTGYGAVGPQTRSVIASVCGGGGVVQPGTPVYTGSNCSYAGGQLASGVVQTFYTIQVAPTGSSCAAFAQTRQCVNGVLSGNPTYQYGSCAEASSLTCTVNGTTINHGTAQTFYSRTSVNTGESCNPYAQVRTCSNGNLSGNSDYRYATCATQAPSSCTVGGVTVAHGSSRTFYKQNIATSTASCSSHGQTRSCNNGVLSGDGAYSYSSCSAGACALDGLTLASGSSTTFYLSKNIPATEQCSSYAQTRSCSSGTLSGNAAYQYASCAPVSGGSCALDNAVLSSGQSGTFYSVASAPAGKSCAEYDQVRTCSNGTLSGTASYTRSSCTDTSSCSLSGVTVPHGDSFTFYNASTVAYGTTCSSKALTRFCVNGALSGSSSYQYASCSVNPPTSLISNDSQLAAALTALESLLKAALVQLDSWF